MPLVRFVLPLLMLVSSKVGAAGAGATGAALSVGVAEGAIPVPDGMPMWMAALFAGVGPAVVWLFTRLLASASALYVARRDNSRRRAADLLALPLEQRGPDSGPIIRAYLDEADDADERARALAAWSSPTTNGGAR